MRDKPKIHSWKVYKKELQALQGAAQNREILNALKDSLEDVKTINELNDRKSHFYHSPEMKLIDKFHGTPHILRVFGLKTNDHRAVDKIFKDANERINNDPDSVENSEIKLQKAFFI